MGSRLTELVQMVDQFHEATVDEAERAEESRDFVDLQQWTEQEQRELRKRGQAPYVYPKLTRKVHSLIGRDIVRQGDPRAVPRTPQDALGAEAATDALRYVADRARLPEVRSRCWESCVIEGYEHLEVSWNGEKSQVELNHIEYCRSIYDPLSRDYNMHDRRFAGVMTWMDLTEAKEEWPDKADELEAQNTAANDTGFMFWRDADEKWRDWHDPTRKRVCVIELYWKDGDRVIRSLFTRSVVLEEDKDTDYTDCEGDPVDPYVFASCYIKKDGTRYGMVEQLKWPARGMNKARAKMLQIFSTRQVFANAKAVEDFDEFARQMDRPDGKIRIKAGAIVNKDFGAFPTGDMGQAHVALMQDAKAEIDEQGGNAGLLGPASQHASGVAIQRRQEASDIELAGPLFRHRQFIQDTYAAIWARIKQNWTQPHWIRIGEEGEERFMPVNQPGTLADVAADLGIVGSPDEAIQYMPQLGEMKVKRNDLARMNVDITFQDGPDVNSTQEEQFEQIAFLAQTRPDVPFPFILEAMPNLRTRNKQRLQHILQQSAEQQSQLQQAQLQIEAQGEQSKLLKAQSGAEKDQAQALEAQAGAALKQEQAMKTRLEALMLAATPISGPSAP